MVTKATPLVIEAVEAYIEARSLDLSANSIRAYGNTLRRFHQWVPTKQLGRLTASDVEGFIVAVKRGDPKTGARRANNDTSIRHVMQTLEGFLQWSYRRGWCRGDLMANTRRPSKSARRDYLMLTAHELVRALDLCTDPRDRISIATAMNTGLRSSEIKILKLGNYDLDNGFVFAAIPKGRETDQMPITLDYEYEIRRWLSYYESECGRLDPTWHMHPARHRPNPKGFAQIVRGDLNPTRPFHDAAVIAHKTLLALGYTQDQVRYEGMHTFRRSVARIYFDAAANEGGYSSALRETAALLHHKNTATTELYLGITTETERRNFRMRGKPFLSAIAAESSPHGLLEPLRDMA